MTFTQETSAEDQIRFDFLRVIRLTAMSFLFVALLSIYSGGTDPSAPAASSGAATVPSTQIILSDS